MAAKNVDVRYIEGNHADCMADHKALLAGIDAGLHGKAVPTEAAVEEAAVREHILVVDDDKMNLKIAERLLKSAYDVSCVPSGEEALEFLRSKRIPPDLHMPGMDGFDVLILIRQVPA